MAEQGTRSGSGGTDLLVIAHRGAPREYPENTLESFQRALEICPEAMLELDLWMTADGAAVVSHDGDLFRACGVRRKIVETTLEELKAFEVGGPPCEGRDFLGAGVRIPLIEEVLDRFPLARISIDIKHHDCSFARSVVKTVRSKNALHRVILGSFCDPLVQRLRADNPGIATFYTRKEIMRLMLTGRAPRGGTHVSAPEFTGGDGARGMPVVTSRFIRAAHRAGVPVYAWTVNRRDRMERLIDRGVDGIVTDLPGLLLEVMKERGIRPAGTAPREGVFSS